MPLANSRTPIGTRGRTGKAIPRTLGVDSLNRLAKQESTTASRLAARRFTPVTLTSTPLGRSPRDAPDRPKVDVGPKSYSAYKSGARSAIRFFVQKRRGRWYVMDMCANCDRAAKTSKNGYATKRQAVQTARRYRDEYGAYAKVPF